MPVSTDRTRGIPTSSPGRRATLRESMRLSDGADRLFAWAVALLGPSLLTVLLVHVSGPDRRSYVFLYLALIAVLGVLRGLWPVLVAAAVSFLQVDGWKILEGLDTGRLPSVIVL